MYLIHAISYFTITYNGYFEINFAIYQYKFSIKNIILRLNFKMLFYTARHTIIDYIFSHFHIFARILNLIVLHISFSTIFAFISFFIFFAISLIFYMLCNYLFLHNFKCAELFLKMFGVFTSLNI